MTKTMIAQKTMLTALTACLAMRSPSNSGSPGHSRHLHKRPERNRVSEVVDAGFIYGFLIRGSNGVRDTSRVLIIFAGFVLVLRFVHLGFSDWVSGDR